MKLTIVLAVALTILVAGCGGDDDDSSSAQGSVASAPEGFNGSSDAADSVGSGTPCCFHGKVSLHFNAYGDYGNCTPPDYQFGARSFACHGRYEANPDNTDPFCCNNNGTVYVRRELSGPNWCVGGCNWSLLFDAPTNQFECYAANGEANAPCYTGKGQAPDRRGEQGGPLRLYVGKSEVFGVHGYVP